MRLWPPRFFFGLGGVAQAATYTVDGLINARDGGFVSSLIHEQDYNGDMSGSTVGFFSETVAPGGIWDDDGSIAFSGLWNGYAYSASGNIDQSTAGGTLDFLFGEGAPFGALSFSFLGSLAMGLPNSFDGSTIYLWGETGTCSDGEIYRQQEPGSCYGIDLRIGVTPVPLPAPALMLLAGLGVLVGLRRRRALA